MTYLNALPIVCLFASVTVHAGACVPVTTSPSKAVSTSSKATPSVQSARLAHASVTGEQEITAYITGYSSETNEPPNSTTIWLDGRQGDAGDTGTYADPITVAVADGQYKYGTMFYLPHVKRYFKASDSCPPCKAGNKGLPWLDVYVGDAGGPEVHKCKAKLTGIREIMLNPKATYPVQVGPIFNGKCTI